MSTIKYYIREGLLRSPHDPLAHDNETLNQLRLIRGLVHVVGLSITQVRRILMLVRDSAASAADAMTDATVVLPLPGARATQRSAYEPRFAPARAALAGVGFAELPDLPYVTQLLAAMTLADECGVGMEQDHLVSYAAAARACAEADLQHVPMEEPQKAAQVAVLGTAIYDSILLGLRRLAHRQEVARFNGSTPGAV